jgi:poly(3-hydroxybutyrate) depolymerase
MMTPTQDAPASEPTTIEAGPLALSARVRRPHQPPRGVIVALHGGTYDSSYIRCSIDTRPTTP